jgi:hypothetical protein
LTDSPVCGLCYLQINWITDVLELKKLDVLPMPETDVLLENPFKAEEE